MVVSRHRSRGLSGTSTCPKTSNVAQKFALRVAISERLDSSYDNLLEESDFFFLSIILYAILQRIHNSTYTNLKCTQKNEIHRVS